MGEIARKRHWQDLISDRRREGTEFRLIPRRLGGASDASESSRGSRGGPGVRGDPSRTERVELGHPS